MVHVTDPLKVMPAYTNNVAYFRLHGLGNRMYYYQYSNEELKRLRGLVESFEDEGKQVYVLFNNLTMFDDAIRFRRYVECGEFPRLTKAVGIESVREVMGRAKFPATKSALLKSVGWKLADLEDGKQVKVDQLLKNIPPKMYENADEVMQKVKLH